jgi:protein SCO1
MVRVIALFSLAAVLLGIAAGAFLVFRQEDGDRFAGCRGGTVASGAADIGGAFSLVDGDGNRVTDTDLIDRPTLVYFGYTFCPDFCPNDMSRNAIARDILAEQGIDVNLAMISIDPARDTPEAMKGFAEAIDPDIFGLTGTEAEVATAANAYRVYYRKAGDDPDYYLMDHSTFTYLMAPGEGFLDFYSSDVRPEDMAERVSCFAEKL